MGKTVKVFLLRHPESLDNKNRVYSGHRDLGLTEAGLRDSEMVRNQLKDVDIAIAYTSPLLRCTNAMDIIMKEHVHTPTIIDSRLKERHYGIFQGLRKDKVPFHLRIYSRMMYRSYLIPPPGGENFKSIWKRVTPFILDLVSSAYKHQGNILICGHHNSNRPIRQYFEGRTIQELLSDRSADRGIKSYDLEVE